MSNVLNRRTLQILRSVNTPDFSEDEWVINPDLSILEKVALRYLKLEKDTLVECSPDEKEAVDVDAALQGRSLEEARASYLLLVNSACEDRIVGGEGVEVLGSGKRVSTSLAAQVKWMGWASIADRWQEMGQVFPFRVRTKLDDEYIEIQDADQVRQVFAAMAAYVAGMLQESEVIKTQIQACKFATELLAVAVPYIEAAPSYGK